MTKSFEELEFTDDFMFCKLLQNNPDVTQQIVELLTGKKIGGIVRIFVNAQGICGKITLTD